ncbi:MAG TPA: outer membrane lipoprotein carrier protein LolA [Ferruginibacter sp.]|jgi:outer membrane lipoprotein-sorting protein|nr:outer membrane lipoprotein carrier protein LolA [Ferruginibacter sp.]
MRKTILLLLTIICALSVKAQHAGYTAITDLAIFKQQFLATAQKTTTIKCDFIQEKNLSMLSEKITSKGKFWFKKNNQVRMEYTQPFQYLMIINQDKVYIKDGEKENTISTKSNKLFQQINKITVDCVQGTALSNPDFSTKVFENKGSYLVELSPVSKNLKDYFSTINIIIDKKDYAVSSIEMNESSGDNTIIKFINKEMNTILPDALFYIK